MRGKRSRTTVSPESESLFSYANVGRGFPHSGIIMITCALSLFGLVMVFSASGVMAENRFHESTYFLKKQAIWLMVGSVALYLASRLDYQVWKQLTPWILGFTVLLLLAVLVIGREINGAHRWLNLGHFSVQPGELAKLSVVLYLASYLTRKEQKITQLKGGILPPVLLIALIAGLILAEPDMGTAVLVILLTGGMLFLGGSQWRHLLGLGLPLIPIGIGLVVLSPERMERLLSFLDPWKDPTGAGYQLIQSFLALGTGGLTGVGLADGKQKLLFLPEAHTDFVLALVGEELGLLGTGSLIILFALLVLKGFQVAAHARTDFGRYLALGITLLFGLQSLINAGVVSGLLPTKGLTLPLVSYGGSSLLTSLLAIGILLSISRDWRTDHRTNWRKRA